MADSVGLRISVDGAGNKLRAMLDRSGLIRGWLNRVAYPLIIEAQRIRWASENASEGSSWPQLNPSYATAKLKRFAAFPGGGRKMLIATGRLVESVTGDNTKDHYKLVEERRLTVGTMVGYAKYVDEDRNFTTFGKATKDNLTKRLNQYIQEGK